MSEKQPRPGQTTLAGSVIIGGSVIVVLSAWQRISTLHTLEAQEDLQQMLGDGMLENLGWSVDDMAVVVRVLCLIGAGAATASTVLGFQVFKRSSSARIVLSVLAPVLLIGGLAVNGFFAPMVAAAIAMLWLQPTRDWYAGRPWMQRYEQRRSEKVGAMRGTSSGESPAASAAPEPVAQQPDTSVVPPPPPSPQASQGSRPVRRRPQRLVSACVVTWVMSGLVIIGLGLLAAILPSQADDILDQMRRDQPDLFENYDMTRTDLLAGVYLLVGVLVVWAIVAIVLAWLAFAGHNWARITLAVSAFVAAVPALFVAASGAWPLVLLVAAFAGSGWMLLRPEVAAWYRR